MVFAVVMVVVVAVVVVIFGWLLRLLFCVVSLMLPLLLFSMESMRKYRPIHPVKLYLGRRRAVITPLLQ